MFPKGIRIKIFQLFLNLQNLRTLIGFYWITKSWSQSKWSKSTFSWSELCTFPVLYLVIYPIWSLKSSQKEFEKTAQVSQNTGKRNWLLPHEGTVEPHNRSGFGTTQSDQTSLIVQLCSSSLLCTSALHQYTLALLSCGLQWLCQFKWLCSFALRQITQWRGVVTFPILEPEASLAIWIAAFNSLSWLM